MMLPMKPLSAPTAWILLLSILAAASSKEERSHPRRYSRSLRGNVKGSFQPPADHELAEAIDHRRQLLQKQKLSQSRGDEPDRSKLFLKRMVLHCDPITDLQNCWAEIAHMGENLVLKRQLVGLHALAVETDESTIEDLSKLGFYFTQDMERETLSVQESLQYHSHRSLSSGQQIGYGLDLIRATQVWDQYQVRGEGVKVCIIDTGVYAAHPDFDFSHFDGWNSTQDFVVPWDEDLAGHGTHITGILVASDNDRGYVGVAPGVDVYIVRVFTDEGKFFGSDVVAAAEACRDAGAHFISMSLGGQGFDQGEYDIFRELQLKYGIIAVASAGNTGGPEQTYPADYSHVVSVTACNDKKRLAGFSSFNSFVDIAAPGVDIPSTYIGTDTDEPYASLSGTSMAAPHVVGTLALMKSYAPDATADELLYVLKHSTQPTASNLNIGIVDAFAAIQMLEAGIDLSDIQPQPCLEAELSITTDQWGQETSYRLRRLSDNKVLWKGVELESSLDYHESSCIDPNDCYEFIILDSYGDGIVEPGGITLLYGEEVELDDGGFGKGGKILFGGGCD